LARTTSFCASSIVALSYGIFIWKMYAELNRRSVCSCEAEDGGALFGLVGADAFENAHAVVQGVGQDVRRGLTPGHQLAVVPDEAVAIRHGHLCSPFAGNPEAEILADFAPGWR
jgi:hypothetical protein